MENKQHLSNTDKHTLDKFFSHLTCASPGYIQDKGLVTVDHNTKVEDVLKKLIENRILSLPVVKDGKAVAIISILDLVAHTLKHFDKSNLSEMTKHSFNFFSLVSEKNSLKEQSVASLEEIGRTDIIVALKHNSHLMEAIRLMAQKDAHRVLVLGDHGEAQSLITQSRIIQLLSLVIDSLRVAHTPISELGIASKNVISVTDTEMARNAFQKMKDNHISGVAVLNKEGKLVGNISASDIKLLGYSLEWFDTLADSSAQYLKEVKSVQDKLPIRSKAFHLGSPGSTNLVIKCNPNTTLGVLIKLVLFYEIHRVYVTDNDDKLLGVVTLGDIIRAVFNFSN